jgi:hypothetical protein
MLDSVEREVIEPPGLDPEKKAALWLYALAMADPRDQEAAPRMRPVGCE